MSLYSRKTLILAFGLNLILLAPWVPGASASEANTAAPSAATPKASLSPADSAVQRNETLAKFHTDLDTLAKKIEEIKIGIAKAGIKAKQKTKDELAGLERTREAVAARLDSLGGATADAWDRLKIRAGKEMDSLKADVDRMKKRAKG